MRIFCFSAISRSLVKDRGRPKADRAGYRAQTSMRYPASRAGLNGRYDSNAAREVGPRVALRMRGRLRRLSAPQAVGPAPQATGPAAPPEGLFDDFGDAA